MQDNKRIACGTSDGPITLFNWDYYDYYKDSILGHPGSVNCFDKYDENMLVTGCEDGSIRLVSLSPKQIKTMISDKNKVEVENESFKDITAITINIRLDQLAVCSNINYIKVYNIENLSPSTDIIENENYESIEMSNSISESEEVEESQSFVQEKESHHSKESNNDIEDEENEDKENDSSFDSYSSHDKKKKQITNNSLKLKALGKKRNSDWVIEKERRKQFFNDI
jgi:hypothetical protein